MPFVSQAQRNMCWALYRSALRSGQKPRWDCTSFSKSGKLKGVKSRKTKKLPYKVSRNVKRKTLKQSRIVKRSNKKSVKKSTAARKLGRKIHTGKRGGKYVIYKGRKQYL